MRELRQYTKSQLIEVAKLATLKQRAAEQRPAGVPVRLFSLIVLASFLAGLAVAGLR